MKCAIFNGTTADTNDTKFPELLLITLLFSLLGSHTLSRSLSLSPTHERTRAQQFELFL